MRLKEDKSNWKASNILRKIVPLPEEPIFHSHKSTLKWCRGKRGMLHAFVEVEKHKSRWFSYTKMKCSNCGKVKYK